MSLKKSVQDRIKQYILSKIEINDSSIIQKTADSFGVSLTTVYRYIKELCDEGIIIKESNRYSLKEETSIKVYETDKRIEEDRVFNDFIDGLISDLPENVYKIWQYAFMEMMNNAIEHSSASEIGVCVIKNYSTTTIIIEDNGIGIFRKIKDYYGYVSLDDAVNELFKGKLTTDSESHSGEGIYFTSRMIEKFCVLSDGKIFTHNTHLDVTRDVGTICGLENLANKSGTTVIMIMPNNSKIDIKEVFDMFSNADEGFVKTHIPMIRIFTDGFPVARSQAKRLCMRFEEFKEVVLDFKDVDDLGQGFAHELFVVFRRKQPDVVFKIENANESVRKMIIHVGAKDILQ